MLSADGKFVAYSVLRGQPDPGRPERGRGHLRPRPAGEHDRARQRVHRPLRGRGRQPASVDQRGRPLRRLRLGRLGSRLGRHERLLRRVRQRPRDDGHDPRQRGRLGHPVERRQLPAVDQRRRALRRVLLGGVEPRLRRHERRDRRVRLRPSKRRDEARERRRRRTRRRTATACDRPSAEAGTSPSSSRTPRTSSPGTRIASRTSSSATRSARRRPRRRPSAVVPRVIGMRLAVARKKIGRANCIDRPRAPGPRGEDPRRQGALPEPEGRGGAQARDEGEPRRRPALSATCPGSFPARSRSSSGRGRAGALRRRPRSSP